MNNTINEEIILKSGITACIATPPDEKSLKYVFQSIDVLKNYVDEIHVQSEPFLSKDLINSILNTGARFYESDWNENFATYKNKSISHVTTPWVLTFDHDEVPTEAMAAQLDILVQGSNKGRNYQMVRFRESLCVDEQHVLAPEPRKLLMHINSKNPYDGKLTVGIKPNMFARANDNHSIYLHFKTSTEILTNSIRNVVLGNDKNNLSSLLKDWMVSKNISTYNEFMKYLNNGNIDIWLKNWMNKASEMESKDNTYKCFSLYYKQKHQGEV